MSCLFSKCLSSFEVTETERVKERERESPLAHRSVGDQLKDWGILGTTM